MTYIEEEGFEYIFVLLFFLSDYRIANVCARFCFFKDVTEICETCPNLLLFIDKVLIFFSFNR